MEAGLVAGSGRAVPRVSHLQVAEKHMRHGLSQLPRAYHALAEDDCAVLGRGTGERAGERLGRVVAPGSWASGFASASKRSITER